MVYKVTLFILIALLLTPKAHAYIDPAAGSLIFQIIIAGFLGTMLALKVNFGKVLGLLRKITKKGNAKEKKSGTKT